jgi:hypothetical protein
VITQRPAQVSELVSTIGSTIFLLAAFALIGIGPTLLVDFTLRNVITVVAIVVIAAGGAFLAGKDS